MAEWNTTSPATTRARMTSSSGRRPAEPRGTGRAAAIRAAAGAVIGLAMPTAPFRRSMPSTVPEQAVNLLGPRSRPSHPAEGGPAAARRHPRPPAGGPSASARRPISASSRVPSVVGQAPVLRARFLLWRSRDSRTCAWMRVTRRGSARSGRPCSAAPGRPGGARRDHHGAAGWYARLDGDGRPGGKRVLRVHPVTAVLVEDDDAGGLR